MRKDRPLPVTPAKSWRRVPVTTTRARTRSPAVELPIGAAPVFERLRVWRAATAKEQGVPAYVVFHDATLREIATAMPSSLIELATISGVGEGKLARYGEGLLATLSS